MKIKIGTRGSKLALYQAELVQAHLRKYAGLAEVEIVIIKTSGDMGRQNNPVPLETKRMFTKEIEDALLSKDIDLAVHSAKDLAARLPAGLMIGAVLEREDARDCFIQPDKKKLAEMKPGAVIGTSALRRQTQLLRHHPSMKIVNMRGNVDTRIKKVLNRECDGILLAYAGVKRLGLTEHVSEVFEENFIFPAPGQGVIVVECRSDDSETKKILQAIHHDSGGKFLAAERAFLLELEGSCQLPCGIRTHINGPRMEASGILLSPYKTEWIEAELIGQTEQPEELGRELARKILKQGGQKILDEIKGRSADKIHKPGDIK